MREEEGRVSGLRRLVQRDMRNLSSQVDKADTYFFLLKIEKMGTIELGKSNPCFSEC